MDAKTRDLALLVGLSLFCAAVAWISDYSVLGSVFFAFGGVAAIEITWDRWGCHGQRLSHAQARLGLAPVRRVGRRRLRCARRQQGGGPHRQGRGVARG